ncbi:D-alanine--D-alanine ligase [bacterium]|nr:D-alanine--D-alanine ligase [bacterium]
MEGDDEEPPPDLLAECDSDETILAVHNALAERYEVISIESDEYAYERLRNAKPHLVFNIAERVFGPNRESHIPSLCEILNIPYTGSDPLTLSLCLDKSRAKEILSYHGIANARFWTIETVDDLPADVTLPAIVKPMYEGSSKGIKNNSVVHQPEVLRERVAEVTTLYQQPVIVEEFLTGREFTVGTLGNLPDLEVLPIVEIDHSRLPDGASPIYSYEAKWIWDVPEKPLEIFRCPAELSESLQQEIQDLVVRVCKVMRLRDWSRIDVRLDSAGRPHILEINPLPGILPNPEDNSCLPKAARTAGYSYARMIHRVVDAAKVRLGLV